MYFYYMANRTRVPFHLTPSPRRLSRPRPLPSPHQAKGVRLMVDAEQTYFQPAIDATVYQLQRKYNVGPGAYTVFSTYQAYLQDTPTRLKDDLQRAER